MKLVQCWDDGVTTDARLVDVLRRHGAQATFNLNAGLHEAERRLSWVYRGSEVWRLGWNEMKAVYDGFTIANHSLTHPHLDQLPPGAARDEISRGRERLQQFFGQSVVGFVYPFGTYNDAVVAAVREAGHVYGRTTDPIERSFPPADPMTLHPSCHFLAPDFWQRHEQARSQGVFHFWGHSYEMTTEAMWAAFEDTLARLGADPQASWCTVAELFDPPTPVPQEG